jgi:hypothetical protein
MTCHALTVLCAGSDLRGVCFRVETAGMAKCAIARAFLGAAHSAVSAVAQRTLIRCCDARICTHMTPGRKAVCLFISVMLGCHDCRFQYIAHVRAARRVCIAFVCIV